MVLTHNKLPLHRVAFAGFQLLTEFGRVIDCTGPKAVGSMLADTAAMGVIARSRTTKTQVLMIRIATGFKWEAICFKQGS